MTIPVSSIIGGIVRSSILVIAFVQFSMAATITAVPAGGRWDNRFTWVGGAIPGPGDDIVIPAGVVVVLRNPYTTQSPAEGNSLVIAGTLIIDSDQGPGARGLKILSNLEIQEGGVLKNEGSFNHVIAVGGNVILNGSFQPRAAAGRIALSLSGSTDQSISSSAQKVVFAELGLNKPSGKVVFDFFISALDLESLTMNQGDLVLPDTLRVSANMVLNKGALISGRWIESKGDITNNGGTIVPESGTFKFSGISQAVKGNFTLNFNNVEIGGGTTLLLQALTDLSGKLLIRDNANVDLANGLTILGSFQVGEGTSGALRIINSAGRKTFKGFVSISKGATWDNTNGDNAHFEAGLENQGNFISGASTNFFEVATQEIKGVIELGKVTIETGAVLVNNGTLRIVEYLKGAGEFQQGPGSTLEIKGTLGVATMVATATGNKVIYSGSFQVVKGINYANLELSGTNSKSIETGVSIISGDLTIKDLAEANFTKELTIGGMFSISGSGKAGIGNGITVDKTTTVGDGQTARLTITSQGGTKTFNGKVVVNPGAIWNNQAEDNIHFNGGLTNEGEFISGSGTHYFEVNAQEVTGMVALSKVFIPLGLIVTNKGKLTITTLQGSGSISQGTGAELNIGADTDFKRLNALAEGNTVNYIGGAQRVIGTNYFNLGLSGSGTGNIKELQTGTTTISGTLTVSVTAQLKTLLTGTLTISGKTTVSKDASIRNTSTLILNSVLEGEGTIIQDPNAVLTANDQNLIGQVEASAAGNTVNLKASAASVAKGTYFNLNLTQSTGLATLAGNVTINAQLSLGSGSIGLGDHNLTIGPLGTISIPNPSATSMVVISGTGRLVKGFDTPGTFTYPIGNSGYSPITVTLNSAIDILAGTIAAGVFSEKAVDNKSSQDFLSRYWELKPAGISFGKYSATASYIGDDISGNESNIVTALLSGSFDQVGNGWTSFQAVKNSSLELPETSLESDLVSILTGISLPTVSVTVSGGDGPLACVGTEFPLVATATGESPLIYRWTPSAGLSSTSIANPVAKPEITTTYTVDVFDVNGVKSSAQTTISVKGSAIQANGIELCFGSSGKLTASGVVTYDWSPATGLSSTTGSEVTAQPTQTTTYTVTGKDELGCETSKEVKVVVNPLPDVTGSDIAICAGQTGTLVAAGASTYKWSPSTGLSTITGSQVIASPDATTTYKVVGLDAKGCKDSTELKVTVKPLPAKPTISSSNVLSDNPSLTSNAVAGNTWYLNGQTIANGSTQTIVGTASGIYTVRVTLDNCQGPLSDPYNLVITGLSDLETGEGFQFFPNPAEDWITINVTSLDESKPYEILVSDLTGKSSLRLSIDPGNKVISTTSLERGIYLVKAMQGNRVATGKFIKL